LQIASLPSCADGGRIGITLCPGKIQSGALSGRWQRDLSLDLDAVKAWGASAVVTLIEETEMRQLGVEALGEAVARRQMVWYHLPIPDVSVPGPNFEQSWQKVGSDLRHLLRNGFNILVHCKGGLGRAGTIAARLMIEMGWTANEAVIEVRQARPGAIETAGQLAYVQSQKAQAEPEPKTDVDSILDRAKGALLGLAVGDALGTPLEFKARDSYEPLMEMTGGGVFGLRPGQWTDDTAMALALADSLLHEPELDARDLMCRFVDWHQNGTYSCTGRCFDIGVTTRQALARWKASGNPFAGSRDPHTAGNGSLMRLAPVAVRHHRNRPLLRDVAARQSRTTHGAAEAIDACVAFAERLADAIEGRRPSEVLRKENRVWAGQISAIMAGSWRGKGREEIASDGYVVHSLEASLWCVGRTRSFREATVLAVNLGNDADTTGAITGQLAGALHGSRGLPPKWVALLAWRSKLEAIAEELFDRDFENAKQSIPEP
jgi:ADP-ribosyl-[dinitrogen reductase] hydrolase